MHVIPRDKPKYTERTREDMEWVVIWNWILLGLILTPFELLVAILIGKWLKQHRKRNEHKTE